MEISLGEHIRNICEYIGFDPVKSKGQNFLINRQVVAQIVRTAELSKADRVLEVGPGLGVLTDELVARAGKVAAIELDKELTEYLRIKFEQADNFNLFEGDALKLLTPAVNWLGDKYKVVANLPYQITSHLLRLLMEQVAPPYQMVLMVQKEVAERICAQPGQMSVLAVMMQYYGQVRLVRVVSKSNFWPQPQVDSAILKWVFKKRPGLTNSLDEKKFFKLVKVGFAQKRKMLKNNLASLYKTEKIIQALTALGLDIKVRPQTLGVGEWLALYKKLE